MLISAAAYKLLGVTAASSVAIGSTGYAGYVVYKRTYKTTETTSTANNGNTSESVTEDKPTPQKPTAHVDSTLSDETLPNPSQQVQTAVLDSPQSPSETQQVTNTPIQSESIVAEEVPDTNYQYVIAKLSGKASTTSVAGDLISGSDKNYLCEITVGAQTTKDTHCKIFKFNTTASTSHLLDLTQAVATSSQITTTSELNDDGLVVLKISKALFTTFNTTSNDEEKTIKLKKTSDAETTFVSLKDFVDLKKSDSDTSFDFATSNLALVKVSSAFSGSETVDGNTTFKVSINGSDIEGCKLYKLPDNFSAPSIATTKFPTITSLSASEDLAQDKYLVLDLGSIQKTHKDLEDSSLEIKINNTIVTSVTFEHLLVGEIKTTLSESVILPIANVHHKSRDTEKLANSNYRYIVTKSSKKTTRAEITVPASINDYICRFNDSDGKVYEDDACLVFELDTADTAKIDFDHFHGTTGKKITTLDVFNDSKQQVVKLTGAFYNKLTSSNLSFDVIQKSKKDQLWHSKYATLTKEFDLTSQNNEGLSSIKTNLVLARLKAKSSESGTVNYLTGTNNKLYCKTTESSTSGNIPCNIYKFSAEKVTNELQHSDFKNITKWGLNLDDLTKGNLYVINYYDQPKGFSHFKSQQKIFISPSDSTNSNTLEFDYEQMLFGHVNDTTPTNSVVFSKAPKLASFIVELDSSATPSSTPINSSNYRCKLSPEASATTKAINYDSSCALVSFADLTEPAKITTLQTFKALDKPTETTNITLSGPTKKFFKLMWDPQKMFNFSGSNMKTTDYSVELVSTDAAATTIYGKFKIKQKIETDKFYGKVDMFVGAPKTESQLTNSAGTCYFNTEASTTFDCSIHSITKTANDATQEKHVIDASPISGTSTTLLTGQYYLIKTNEPRPRTDWLDKSITFKNTGQSEQTIEFNVSKFVSGSLTSSNSELFYLS